MADAFLMVTENIYKALTMRYFETRILLTFIMATALIGSNAHAACTMPGGAPDAGAGDIIFNGPPNNVMQYCDGTNWVAMSGGGGGVPELPSAEIFVGNASNVATARAVSGDATLSNAGVLTIGNNAITSAKIADGTIVGADIANATITTNKMSAGGTANGTTFLRGDGQWVAPTFSYTETDPKVGATTNDKWCRGDGTQIVCDQDEPTGGGGGGSGPLVCTGGVNPQEYNGRCYTRLLGSYNHPQAISACQTWGGAGAGLVIINDAAEQAFITTNYASTQGWIGLTDSGSYGSSEGNPRWWDGTEPTYTNSPSNNNGSRDWVRLNTNGTWRYEATSLRSAICESPNIGVQSTTMTCSDGSFHGQIVDNMICIYGLKASASYTPPYTPPEQQACFGAGAQVLLADGGTKAIEALEIGDKVLGRGGVTNTIIALKSTTLGDRKLYTINGTLKVTADHPAMTERGWGVLSRALYAQRYHNLTMSVTVEGGQEAAWETSFLPPEEMVEFGTGDKIAFGNSGFQKITSLTYEVLAGDTPLYTVALDGDGTFQLEGGYVFIGLSGGLVDQKQVGLMRQEERQRALPQ